MIGICRICSSEEEIRNINLFVNGSEGINLCHFCEMSIVELIRRMQLVGAKTRKKAFLDYTFRKVVK